MKSTAECLWVGERESNWTNWQVNPGAEVDIGANASAEEVEEEVQDDAVQINDVVYSMRLQSTEFDKKSYMTYIKGKFFLYFFTTSFFLSDSSDWL